MRCHIHAAKDSERGRTAGDAVDEHERDRNAGRLSGLLALLRFQMPPTGHRRHGPEQGHKKTGPQDQAGHGGNPFRIGSCHEQTVAQPSQYVDQVLPPSWDTSMVRNTL